MFGLFKKKKVEVETPTISQPVRVEQVQQPSTSSTAHQAKRSLQEQSDWLIENGWISTPYSKQKKTILIMDDREEIISSMIDDLKALDSTNSFFFDDYNIITVFTKMAGFDVIDIIEQAPDIEINYALLDIILGGKKVVDGVRVMVDGVDVAIRLYKRFSSIDILFFSGCIIEASDDPSHFKNRFENYIGDDMNNYILPKDVSFDEELKKLSEFFNGF